MNNRYKLICLVLIGILILGGCSVIGDKPEEEVIEVSPVFSANLDGFEFTPAEVESGLIKSGFGTEEIIDSNYVGLFVNGEFIMDSGVKIVEDRVEAPISKFTNSLGMETGWDATTRILTIRDGENVVKVDVDKKMVEKNGESVELGEYPKIIEDKIYGNSEFFTKAFNAKISFYNGQDSTATKMLPRLKHVMISRYPENAVVLTKEQGMDAVKKNLIIAYEKRYGKYEPLEGDKKVSIQDPNYEAEKLKEGIRDLRITAENDRFYIIPFAWDFWVDKYTGEVYTFYNGLTMQIRLFNPHTKGALTFAG